MALSGWKVVLVLPHSERALGSNPPEASQSEAYFFSPRLRGLPLNAPVSSHRFKEWMVFKV